jgi:hypothetical protein
MALNGRGDTHQICPLLKVNRPCNLAAVTSQFDPEQSLPGLKSRSAAVSCRSSGVLSFLVGSTGGIGQ